VHHIVEQKDGGSHELDNLIAICVSCHSDVHTNTKLSRRFTARELKLHRREVYRLVGEGKLPSGDGAVDDLVALTAAVLRTLQSKDEQGQNPDDDAISIEGLDILISGASIKAPVRIQRHSNAVVVNAGQANFIFGLQDLDSNGHPEPVRRLLSLSLVEGTGDTLNITPSGYALVDDILSANPSFTQVKAKCLNCSLHFIVCTDSPERHSAATLICPECAQCQGRFLLWYQRMFGFIFQVVPGRQQSVAGASIDLVTDKRQSSES